MRLMLALLLSSAVTFAWAGLLDNWRHALKILAKEFLRNERCSYGLNGGAFECQKGLSVLGGKYRTCRSSCGTNAGETKIIIED
ncbi:MAG TPA: hypothetical protein PKD37_02595 [Oligoflexia bacterium]|nr:hypothetical protein [Oligoflexia bacterium]HMP26859.1 hypothetical protein [Oligoflexia bacterium]